MQEYLLKVSKSAETEVARWLGLPKAPTYVRLNVLAPLSNWGYPPNSDSALLNINAHGVVTGQAGGDDAPHDFVPWQNVAYLSDGTKLATEVGKK